MARGSSSLPGSWTCTSTCTRPRNGIPSSSWPPASPRCSTSAANLTPQGFWLAEPAKLNPFEYGGWLWRWLGDLDPRSDAVHRLYDGLIATGTALDPTLVLYAARPGALGDDVGDTSMDDPERTKILSLLPTAVGKELAGRWTERRAAAHGASEAAQHRMRRAWDNILTLVGGFHRAGGMVLAGTHFPQGPTGPGFSLPRVAARLGGAGSSPRERDPGGAPRAPPGPGRGGA